MTMHPDRPIPRPCAFLDAVEAYLPGEQPTDPEVIKLNTNEFPYPPAPEVLEAIRRQACDALRMYPDPTAAGVREALAVRHGIDPRWILVGNGSDEILRLLAHAYLEAGRRLAIVEPTYTLYEVLAGQFQAQVHTYPLEDGEHLPKALFEGDWTACFLPVPNPPLGTVFPEPALRRLVETGRLVVLDGAYMDFAQGPDPLDLLERFPNLVLTRSFSKSFGMAGLRLGYAMAHPELLGLLHKLRDSYNINRVSQAAGVAAVGAEAYYADRCAEIVRSRQWLSEELAARGFFVHVSQGNFVLARNRAAPRIYEALKRRGILVRYFARPGLEDGLRITIGTPAENAALVETLDALRREGHFD